jgi:hypothetical protein
MTKSQQNKTTKMLNLCENHLFKLKKNGKKMQKVILNKNDLKSSVIYDGKRKNSKKRF